MFRAGFARFALGIALCSLIAAAGAVAVGQLHPHSGMIAFVTNSRAMLLDPTSGKIEMLRLPAPVPPYSLAWTRDGQHMAFFTQSDSGVDLFTADSFGGHVRRLWHDTSRSAGSLTWSPNARYLLFSSGSGIHIADVETRTVRRVPDTYGRAQSPVWSPDSQQIAFSLTQLTTHDQLMNTIYTVARDGTNLRNVTSPATGGSAPRWSPNQQQIAYLAVGEQGEYINLFDLERGADLRLTGDIVSEAPTWSPDGRWLAFTSLDCAGCPTGVISVVSADGGTQRRLIPDEVIAYRSPVWSPDGGRLAFIGSWSFYDNRIYVADASGGAYHAVTGGLPPITYLAWLP